MALAGLSVQQDHWKDNTSRKLQTLSHSVNRTLSTAPEVTATMAVMEDLRIRLSGTSKPMVAYTEESYPYEARDGPCRFQRAYVGATVTGKIF